MVPRFADLWKTSIWLLLTLGLAGCGKPAGPELAKVQGVILLDGQPLPEARVIFQPSGAHASPSIGQTRPDGSFELAFNRRRRGAMLGTHRVRITTTAITTDPRGRESVIPERLPPRYHAHSELTYEVKSGANRFEILLASKPDPQVRTASVRKGS